MGHLITFLGASQGQTGNTANMIGASTMLALDYTSHLLAAQSDTFSLELEKVFRKAYHHSRHSQLDSSGYDAIENLVRSGQLNAEIFKDYTAPIIPNYLDVLQASKKINNDQKFTRISESIDKVCQFAVPAYDLTLFDLVSGTENSSVDQQIIDNSNLVVISLNQNKKILDYFFEQAVAKYTHKKVILVIGQYDQYSQWNEKNIARMYKTTLPIVAIPHSASYMDALNDNKVIEFFLKRKNVDKSNSEYSLIQAIRKLNETILKSLEIQHKMIAREA